jgi:hypothetical protein
MAIVGITVEGGITIENGIGFGAQPAPPPPGNPITYAQMPGPVTKTPANPSNLQDATATINNPVGFTINNISQTGVAVFSPDANSQAFFNTNGVGTYNVALGAGSTVATTTATVTQVIGATIIFFFNGVTQPTTFNFPFTFSI